MALHVPGVLCCFFKKKIEGPSRRGLRQPGSVTGPQAGWAGVRLQLRTVCLTRAAGHIHVPLAAARIPLPGWHCAHVQAGSSLPLGSGARELGLAAGIGQGTEGAWLRLCLASLRAPRAQEPHSRCRLGTGDGSPLPANSMSATATATGTATACLLRARHVSNRTARSPHLSLIAPAGSQMHNIMALLHRGRRRLGEFK